MKIKLLTTLLALIVLKEAAFCQVYFPTNIEIEYNGFVFGEEDILAQEVKGKVSVIKLNIYELTKEGRECVVTHEYKFDNTLKLTNKESYWCKFSEYESIPRFHIYKFIYDEKRNLIEVDNSTSGYAGLFGDANRYYSYDSKNRLIESSVFGSVSVYRYNKDGNQISYYFMTAGKNDLEFKENIALDLNGKPIEKSEIILNHIYKENLDDSGNWLKATYESPCCKKTRIVEREITYRTK